DAARHTAAPSAAGDAATRIAPVASVEELELVEALKDERSFLQQATYYRVLEITPETNDLAIAEAFNRFASRWHPDRLSADASQEMGAIAGEIYLVGKAAYDILIDGKKRKQYKPKLSVFRRKSLAPKSAPAGGGEKKAAAAMPPPPPPMRDLPATART